MALPSVGYYTTRMGFYIAAGTDQADYETIVNALLKTDGASGLVLCTEATKPTTYNYPGKYIKCTDSGKHYYLDATGSFTLGVYTGGAWIEDNYLTAVSPVAGNVFYGGRSTGSPDLFITTNTGATWPRDTVSGKASTSVPTAIANQRYRAEVTIQYDPVNEAGMESNGVAIYLTIDGSDTQLGTLQSDGVSGNTNNAGAGAVSQTFVYNSTLVAAGAHTFSIKAAGGHNTGGATVTICQISAYNLEVTLSS